MARRFARAAAALLAGALCATLLPGCDDPRQPARKSPRPVPKVQTVPPPASAPVTSGAAAEPAAAPGIAPGSLRMPVAGADAAALRDSYDELRANRRHEALDIAAPRGTPVVAVAEGPVVKLFDSKPGGLTVYQFDTSGRFAFYYAHLDRYADTLAEGAQLRPGDPVGFVGSSGNASADAPHLHFAVFELGPQRRWWQGRPVNPHPLIEGTRPKP